MPRVKAVATRGDAPAVPFELAFKSEPEPRPEQPPGIPMETVGAAKVFDAQVHPEERMNPEYHAKAQEKFKADKAKAAFGFGAKTTVIGQSPNAPGNTKFVFN